MYIALGPVYSFKHTSEAVITTHTCIYLWQFYAKARLYTGRHRTPININVRNHLDWWPMVAKHKVRVLIKSLASYLISWMFLHFTKWSNTESKRQEEVASNAMQRFRPVWLVAANGDGMPSCVFNSASNIDSSVVIQLVDIRTQVRVPHSVATRWLLTLHNNAFTSWALLSNRIFWLW